MNSICVGCRTCSSSCPFSRQFFRKKDIGAEHTDRMFLTLTFVACGGVLVALLAGVSYITPLLSQ
ncbi:MAG TPA: hypothetical protein PLX35_01100 [Cyclobacteriaceae bacterium]|nr:hypothetical protein [Cyclobacteriaceae bacterium]